jgi:RimJ/RimL family protein N-acetyltransferase
MKYFKKMIGEKTYLAPMNMDDLEKYAHWVNDLNVTLFTDLTDSIIEQDKERQLLHNLTNNPRNRVMVIISRETDTAIGFIGLHEINWMNRNAALGIMIGDKGQWNKGYGTEAISLMLDFGFNVLNLNSVYLRTISFNARGMRCFEKCGFKQAGVSRQFKFIAGQYYDMIHYDILAEEFKSVYFKDMTERSMKEDKSLNKISIL